MVREGKATKKTRTGRHLHFLYVAGPLVASVAKCTTGLEPTKYTAVPDDVRRLVGWVLRLYPMG